MPVRARAVVRGRVQGVCFRAATVSRAKELGLRGWVRNRADGSVEAVFEGPKARVEAALVWFKRGPSAASVEEFEVRWERPTGKFKDFSQL